MVWFTKDAAFNGFLRLLTESGARIDMVSIPNNSRHKVIKSSFGYFYCLFKERAIDSFNYADCTQKFLKEHPEDKGHGESINVDSCMYAIERGYPVLIYLYPKEEVYCIQASKVREMCSEWAMVHSRGRDEQFKQLNSDGSCSTILINEREYWFPQSWLMNFRKILKGDKIE